MIYLKDSDIKVEGAADVAKMFQDLLALEDSIEQDKEHFYVMHLTVKDQVKMVELVNVGILNSAPVNPRETFRRAVLAGSAAIIIALTIPPASRTPQMRIQN